jgi:hypothetical protein
MRRIRKMNDSERAFPVRNRFDSANESFDLEDPGMTLKKYAAIKLHVPMSGDVELDAMIRESRRADFAEAAMAGILAKVYRTKDYNGTFLFDDIADEAYIMAEALEKRIEEGNRENIR